MTGTPLALLVPLRQARARRVRLRQPANRLTPSVTMTPSASEPRSMTQSGTPSPTQTPSETASHTGTPTYVCDSSSTQSASLSPTKSQSSTRSGTYTPSATSSPDELRHSHCLANSVSIAERQFNGYSFSDSEQHSISDTNPELISGVYNE